jgi:hypothetical protein
MEEYTDLTPCDTQRAEAVTAYKDDPTDPYALKLIDEFIYGLCEVSTKSMRDVVAIIWSTSLPVFLVPFALCHSSKTERL